MDLSQDFAPDDFGRCMLCPRGCGTDRRAGERGLCGMGDAMVVARSALHFWEEPVLSGSRGSGTIFFSGCPLRCCYCQNAVIAEGLAGKAVQPLDVAAMALDLQGQGALNVNLVTPTHFAPLVRRSIALARERGLSIPVVWNTSGYETVESVRGNRGVVDVYLTDFKYASPQLARRYSRAEDYPQVALTALDAMVEEAGRPAFDEVDGDARMVGGVIVRHLLLPGQLADSMAAVSLLHERYGDSVVLSLMNQYTPVLAQRAQDGDVRAQAQLEQCPELGSAASGEDYERLLDYADSLGIEDYFWQDGPAAQESFIPAFDLTGVA